MYKDNLFNIENNLDYKVVNEAYPHIGNKIKVFWGYPELISLLIELEKNDSDRPRVGFPSKVLSALISLEETHDIHFPHLKRKIESNWHTL